MEKLVNVESMGRLISNNGMMMIAATSVVNIILVAAFALVAAGILDNTKDGKGKIFFKPIYIGIFIILINQLIIILYLVVRVIRG